MTDSVPIRPATIADATSIADIYAHYVLESTATFETEPPDAAEMTSRMEKVFEGGYPWLVACDDDGSVLGYAYASKFHPREGYRLTCETSIYVRKDAMRRGIGTALIEALVSACEKIGMRQAIAVIAGTEPASVVLHARAGFRPSGTLETVGRKHGKWIDVFFMQRQLGEGADTPPAEEPD